MAGDLRPARGYRQAWIAVTGSVFLAVFMPAAGFTGATDAIYWVFLAFAAMYISAAFSRCYWRNRAIAAEGRRPPPRHVAPGRAIRLISPDDRGDRHD